ncbi:MAG: AraC family ligand binding domain-containing protein, partial [Oscillospiraceae bacterium]
MDFESSIFSQEMKLSVHNAVIQQLPPNYHFPTHMHNTVELILCTEGLCIVHFQDQVVEIVAGEYILLFPGVLHDTCTSRVVGCAILQTHFYVDIFKVAVQMHGGDSSLDFLVEASAGKRKFFKCKTSPRLYQCVDSIRAELQEKGTAWRRMLDLSLLQIITLLSRDLQGSALSGGAYRNKYLIRSLDYINEHCGESISAREIAD